MSPLLGFSKEFARDVRSGAKRQTIRAYRKDRRDPKVGQTLYLWTGLRRPGARKLGEKVCLSVYSVMLLDPSTTAFSPVRMGNDSVPRALFDLDYDEREALADRDGFLGAADMLRWFDKVHGLPFRGLVIRW